MRIRRSAALGRREQAAERRALLIAYAFQSPWAAKHLPPESAWLRCTLSPELQLKHQYSLAAQRAGLHLNFEIVDRIWDEAKILHEAGPLAISKLEADLMRSTVLDMETSAKLYRGAKQRRRQRRCP